MFDMFNLKIKEIQLRERAQDIQKRANQYGWTWELVSEAKQLNKETNALSEKVNLLCKENNAK